MVLGQRVTLSGLGSLGKVKSAALSPKKLRRLEARLEEKRVDMLQAQLLEDERDYSKEVQMLSFGVQEQESIRQAELTGEVMEYVPWILGGVGLLIATGVGVMILKPKKKKKVRGRKK